MSGISAAQLARDAIIEIRGLLEKASLPTASLHALETALGALAKRKGATQRKARRAWAAVADVAFSRRRLEKERDQAIARAVVAENLLDRAGALLLDAEWNTHHSAENSYCRWCHNAKDAAGKERFDTWQDQTEHAPECPYAAWRACAGRIAGDGKARP